MLIRRESCTFLRLDDVEMVDHWTHWTHVFHKDSMRYDNKTRLIRGAVAD